MIAARRPLATRNAAWAKRLASALAVANVRPNAVSVASVVCAGGAAFAFARVPAAAGFERGGWLLLAAAGIQVRLLCNLLDGMLAVEEGLHTPAGVLFNEIPDRIADVLILVGAGYAGGSMTLGWLAAVGALFTAYVRQLGGVLTGTQDFGGPMAKQHRMFALTLTSVLAAAGPGAPAFVAGLAVIAAGSIVTAWRRLARVVRVLEEQCSSPASTSPITPATSTTS